MFSVSRILRVAAVAVMLPAASMAATFNGAFWDATGVYNLARADLVVANDPITATFQSTAIDYPNVGNTVVGGTTTLSTFLGADAGTLSGSGTSTLDGSVFRFTGYLDLVAGQNTFAVGSDDGFRLTVGGVELGSSDSRAFATSTIQQNFAGGVTDFELMYFNNLGGAGVQFSLNGALATPAATPVPLPAALPLMLVALGGLGLAARRKKA